MGFNTNLSTMLILQVYCKQHINFITRPLHVSPFVSVQFKLGTELDGLYFTELIIGGSIAIMTGTD